ncbi:prepilin peptidase [Christensenella minuta]|uniref:prepilin peptidase n=1 Tax=Christensenella minuta TaxID=626937 RepID=UPI002A7F37CD|nr:prepilin peptidase [Christensenella minuta]MDY3751328.1 prepilin peptidase [Christensenella minuta]
MQLILVVSYIFLFVLGLIIGSFLNVCIYRIPRGVSVASGRSVCPGCGSMIHGYDNIPVLSYLLLRGKCRSCGARISPRYPLVELLTAGCFLLCGVRYGISIETVLFCVFSAVLVAVAFIDIDTQEIPDRFHFIILGLGIAALFLVPEVGWISRLVGAACISVPMLVIALATDGFGIGDVKLMAVSGFLLGWKNIVFAALAGAVLAAVCALVLIALKRKTKKDKIAFGPYLAIALFTAALFGDTIVSAYLSLFSL